MKLCLPPHWPVSRVLLSIGDESSSRLPSTLREELQTLKHSLPARNVGKNKILKENTEKIRRISRYCTLVTFWLGKVWISFSKNQTFLFPPSPFSFYFIFFCFETGPDNLTQDDSEIPIALLTPTCSALRPSTQPGTRLLGKLRNRKECDNRK